MSERMSVGVILVKKARRPLIHSGYYGLLIRSMTHEVAEKDASTRRGKVSEVGVQVVRRMSSPGPATK